MSVIRACFERWKGDAEECPERSRFSMIWCGGFRVVFDSYYQ
jgi:hypothetical protein